MDGLKRSSALIKTTHGLWAALAVLGAGWAVAAWADPPVVTQPAVAAVAMPAQSPPAPVAAAQALPMPVPLPASPLDPLPAPTAQQPQPMPNALPTPAALPLPNAWARPLRETPAATPGAAVEIQPNVGQTQSRRNSVGETPALQSAAQQVLYNAPGEWRGDAPSEGWRSAGQHSQSYTNQVQNDPYTTTPAAPQPVPPVAPSDVAPGAVQNTLPADQPSIYVSQPSTAGPLKPLTDAATETPPATGPAFDEDALAAADPLAGPQIMDEEGRLPFEVVEHTGEMQIMLRRSKILRTHHDIYRTQVVDPRICNVVQFTPREVSIIGLAQGATHVTFWFENGGNRPVTYLIRVTPDVEVQKHREEQYRIFEEILQEIFPDSKVYLVPVSDKLIVKGQAKDAEEAAQIMSVIRGQAVMGVGGGGGGFNGAGGLGGGFGGNLAEGVAAEPFAGQGGNEWGGRALPPSQVINMLRIPGVQQVALKVRIAELNRTRARRFGVDLNMNFAEGNVLLQSLLNASSGSIATLAGAFDGDKIKFGLHYLEQEGIVRLLSEPTLVTLSGRPASFVAGGEFAVPTTVGVGGAAAVTTDFRSFGAIITFLPIVLDKDRVRLQVSPEFSQVNRGLSVNNIPGLTSRAVTTTVEMREGQTLAIAGLLDDSTNASLSGSVPFFYRALGLRQNNKSETELIILVTPELVHPMDPEEVPPLPGFDVTEPTNAQFYLQGKLEGTPTLEYRSTVWPRLRQRYQHGGAAMISGPFGHGR